MLSIDEDAEETNDYHEEQENEDEAAESKNEKYMLGTCGSLQDVYKANVTRVCEQRHGSRGGVIARLRIAGAKISQPPRGPKNAQNYSETVTRKQQVDYAVMLHDLYANSYTHGASCSCSTGTVNHKP